MKTVTIQIGNSDDKLTQVEWSNYITSIERVLERGVVHFSGGSACRNPWQNYCWVVNVSDDELDDLKRDLGTAGKVYRQESVALTIGETYFL